MDMNMAGWEALDLAGDRRKRWCVVLIPPNLEHLRDAVHPVIGDLFRQLIPIDYLLRQLYIFLLHAPLPEFRVHAGVTDELGREYTRVVRMLLPQGIVTPIEETIRNVIIDYMMLIDEAIDPPYQLPRVLDPDMAIGQWYDWFDWQKNAMTDGDDEAVAAQVLLRMRPSIMEGLYPWDLHRDRKAITQAAWGTLANMISEKERVRFQQNAKRLESPLTFGLIDMLMTCQFIKFMQPREAARLPVLLDLCPFTTE